MLSLILAMMLVSQAGPEPAPGPVSPRRLAKERSESVRNLRYELLFVVPADMSSPVQGQVTIRFSLIAPHRVVLDFAQPADRVRSVRAAGADVRVTVVNGHMVIPAGATRAGENEVVVEFVAGDDPLNRNAEFLYTLFVPARAQRAFPCFDQPDLKARYTLSLEVPEGWKAVSNGAVVTTDSSAGRTRIRFAETEPLSTYLFAFVAGQFSVETATRNGREFRLFHRETDAAKVARNREAIFDLHAAALGWLEDYTAIPYPFGKFDVVAIPSFQFGGMEHPGAILYNAAGVLLDESATQNQMLDRANVISHETAHMWFGDLVTMRWFNDVWMKEVFANFMAGKIVNPSFPQVNHDLRFLLANYPGAYQVDRTAGTNAIRQPLANLDDAGQLYGAVIYQKAPIVMRQLETIVGDTAFRDGLREDLRTYSFGNATWLDLVRILDARTSDDLAAWSRAWVEERGRPEVRTDVRVDERPCVEAHAERRGSVSTGIDLAATVEGRARIPGRHSRDCGERQRRDDGRTRGRRHALPAFCPAQRRGPWLRALPSRRCESGLSAGQLPTIPDPLTRGSAWVTLWDNLLESRVGPEAFIDLALRALPTETDEQNVQRVLGYTTRAFWRHLVAEERVRRAPVTRARSSRWDRSRRDEQREVRMVLRLQGRGAQSRWTGWLEAVWRRNEKIRWADVRGDRRDRHGPRVGRPRGPGVGGDPADPARSHAKPRSQGAVRICDAGIVSRSRRA